MSLTTAIKNALNAVSNTFTELAEGYNDLSADVQLGDIIDNAGRSATATLANATNTVVADTNIQAGDEVIVQAQDAAGAALTGVFVDPANIVAGVSFRIDHSIAAGTEVFSYQISR